MKPDFVSSLRRMAHLAPSQPFEPQLLFLPSLSRLSPLTSTSTEGVVPTFLDTRFSFVSFSLLDTPAFRQLLRIRLLLPPSLDLYASVASILGLSPFASRFASMLDYSRSTRSNSRRLDSPTPETRVRDWITRCVCLFVRLGQGREGVWERIVAFASSSWDRFEDSFSHSKGARDYM